MRLSAEQVKAALLHCDQDVRTLALCYFADAFSSDPGVMPLAIEAIERWGWKEAFETTLCIRNLVQTEESVRWLISQASEKLPAKADDESRYDHIVRTALIQADVTVLERCQSEVLNFESLDDEVRKKIAERISLMASSPNELWRQLEDICRRSDNADAIPHPLDFAFNLVEALGRHSDFSAPRVLAILSSETGDSGKWLEVFAVRLAGELRQEAIPQIIALLHDADDWIFEEGERALIKIGDDSVVEQLADVYSTSEFGLRIAGAFILRSIHTDSSVAASLRLAESEEDQDVKNLLIESAIANFDTDAIEPARQHVLSVSLDPEVIEVRNSLITCCKLLGETFPEFDVWVEAQKHDQEVRRSWYDGGLLRPHLRAMEEQLAEDEVDAAPLPPPATIFRDEARVGRNDHCPCGSGKKFKRCCLKDRHSVS